VVDHRKGVSIARVVTLENPVLPTRERRQDRDLPVRALHETRHTYAWFGIAAGL
jgi:hypothetical protein